MIRAPFHYIGNKFSRIEQILENLPDEKVMSFFDMFGGSGVVGLNVLAAGKCKTLVYNERRKQIANLFQRCLENDTFNYLTFAEIVERSNKNYENTKEAYLTIRNSYNGLIKFTERFTQDSEKMVLDCLLYQIISRSFSNDIRFNKKGEVNIPYGDRNYCDVSRIEELAVFDLSEIFVFIGSYIDCFQHLNSSDFVFIDPPYYNTTSTYNNGWSETDEKLLYKNLDYLSSLGIKWMLTNTVENRGNVNEILKKWLDDNKDKLYTKQINGGYGNSSFRKSSKPTIELMVTNYPMKGVNDA